MIVILHKNNKVVDVFDCKSKKAIQVTNSELVTAFFEIAKQFKDRLIIWCVDYLKDFIDYKEFSYLFQHKLIMASYNLSESFYIDEQIGYVESSPFIKINRKAKYPTWLMSSSIGGINSNVLCCFNQNDYRNETFDYVLNSIAKRGISNGLFCYSSPKLLNTHPESFQTIKTSKCQLFKFIRQHYKGRWAFLTLFNSCVYEKRLFLLPFITSYFNTKKLNNPVFKNIKVTSKIKDNRDFNIDVVIPTIGRRQYLYDVLKDLSNQTLLPKNVIVIEQNTEIGSATELNFIKDESWPFKINHKFINQTGACNARNLALSLIESDWIFMADDDIRFENEILEIALKEITTFGLSAATLSCLRKGDKEMRTNTMQWNTFGSGCSIISNQVASKIRFDIAYEHGFGEDGDFGMQIRNLGYDIGYIPKCNILHLKAPLGGFRTIITQPWDKDKIQPKPSPTIMLFNLKNQSFFQINGYKTILFFKYFKLQNNKNPFSYFFQMKKRWKKSIFLANQLKIKTSR
jgi:glycosyltransferase involved in cell wall biosynthesis